MKYAVELFFDKCDERHIREAWRLLAEASTSDYLTKMGVRPHVALLVFDKGTASMEDIVHNIVRSELSRSVNLEFNGVGEFDRGSTAVSFIHINKTKCLREIYVTVHDLVCSCGVSIDEYYQWENWTPHCTVAQGFPIARLQKVQTILKNLEFPAVVSARTLGVVQFPPSETIFEMCLTGSR